MLESKGTLLEMNSELNIAKNLLTFIQFLQSSYHIFRPLRNIIITGFVREKKHQHTKNTLS